MKLEGIRCFLVLPACAVLFVLGLGVRTFASQPQLLSGHVPPAIQHFHLQSTGRLPAQEQLSLIIGLPLRNSAEFHQLAAEIYDPASPEYHHYLTPRQIADRFGPTEQDYEAVAIFAQTNGLQIVRTHGDRTLLTVEGKVADIERTFHLHMLVYQHPTEARTFYAPDTEPSVNLNVPLLHISGLDSYILPHPGGHPGNAHGGAKSGAGSAPDGSSYLGNDFRKAYVPGTSLTGSGQSVGLLELDAYYTNDIINYETLAGLPSVTITNVLLDGATGTPDSDNNSIGEVSLDMEMVMAMAPGMSRLIVYEAPNCCYYWEDIIKQMQEDDSASQLSSSWLFDYDANVDTIYQELAIQGQSFFQCSGDDLAFYKNVGQWTDDPNVTLVGGTTLTAANNQSWVSETVWNNGDGVNGSGGGVSASYMGNYPIPSWQKGIGTTANGASSVNRNVPDVAMVANHAWVVWADGSQGWWWGTSIAAPLWAGFTALANQQAVANSEPTLGFLNPALYSIGSGALYGSCFHDIVTGNNTNSHSANLYFAVPGYDLCTGLGTPNGVNLIDVLTQTPDIYSSVHNTNGSVTFWSLCVPGSTNVVLSATNFVSPIVWKAISTNIAGSAGTWAFTDTNALHYKSRFYKLQSYSPGR
ncbi:MAG TPA: S53 family serine peptidase [Verrucomicrobiae bacterium]